MFLFQVHLTHLGQGKPLLCLQLLETILRAQPFNSTPAKRHILAAIEGVQGHCLFVVFFVP